MRFGSVCSGIEAASVAWDPLGWEAAWFSEIEPFPCRVLAHRLPSVPNLGDMTALESRILAGEVEAPDVLVGGTPCQAFSVAGLRGSLGDARGNLALVFVRLANAIDKVRKANGKSPAWIVWENVPGVLSTADNAFGHFLGGLVGADSALAPRRRWTSAGVASGPRRVAAWRVLDAQYFGVAQRRRRVFVLARGGVGAWVCADALLPIGPRGEEDSEPRRAAREAAAGGAGYRTSVCSGHGWWSDSGVGATIRAQDSINKADTLVSELAKCITTGEGGRLDGETCTFVPEVANALRAEGFDASEDGTGRQPAMVAFSSKDFGADATENLAPTLRAGHHNKSHANGGCGPAVAFSITPESAQGADLRATEIDIAPALTATAEAKATDSGVRVMQPLGQFVNGNQGSGGNVPWLPIDGPHNTLQASKAPNSVAFALNPGWCVRRLSPTECERLQGFPDGWTLIPGAADGPRYRALGNSMAVPVMRWIGRRIGEVAHG